MTNYKHIQQVSINIGGYQQPLKTSDKLIGLYKTATASTIKTMETMESATDYQVPTGKKAKIVYIRTANQNSAADQMYYSDTADSSTNPVMLLDADRAITDELYISVSIPAGKYINFIDNTTGHIYNIIILEENA